MNTLLGIIGFIFIILGGSALLADGEEAKKEGNKKGCLIWLGILGLFLFFSALSKSN